MNKKYQVKDISDKQVCIATNMYKQNNDKFIYDYLQEITGAPFKVCYRAMERAEERGYIAYGVSLRTAWLDKKGKELLEGINQ